MTKRAHLIAGLLATLTIATFFLPTIIVEVFGSHEAVATVKSLIVMPGLFVLVPLIGATGGSAVDTVIRVKRHEVLDRRVFPT